MGFAPTWFRQVSPHASQNHFNHWEPHGTSIHRNHHSDVTSSGTVKPTTISQTNCRIFGYTKQRRGYKITPYAQSFGGTILGNLSHKKYDESTDDFQTHSRVRVKDKIPRQSFSKRNCPPPPRTPHELPQQRYSQSR